MKYFVDYVLLDIFKSMDHNTLVTCTEVCKRWKELIEKSKDTSEEMTLYIKSHSNLSLTEKFSNLQLERQYKNLNLKQFSMHNDFEFIVKALNGQKNLRNLTIEKIHLRLKDFLRNLKNFQSLEKLEIFHSEFSELNVECEKISLPNLKTLKIIEKPIVHEDYALVPFLHYLQAENLEIFYISAIFSKSLISNEFLLSLKLLKDLKINGKRNLENAFQILTSKEGPKIQLRKFSTESFLTSNETTVEFFYQQRNSLEILELNRLDFDLMKFILHNLNLKSLKFKTFNFPSDSLNFVSIPKDLIKLEISSMTFNTRSNKFKAQQIFQFYSNIRELKLNRRDNDEENQMTLNMPELNILTIEQFFSSQDEENSVNFDCRLPNLQIFTLISNGFSINRELLEKFKKNFPKLKFLNLFENELNKKFLNENSIQDIGLNIKLYSEEFLKENRKYERIAKSLIEPKDNINLININFI
ncbi:hypothetical protein PVAND_002483 [Polypedilum vanderplanki]|uniref:F-box domain-containing protein n=1 Tax=Polypedilum vanderplanki TaxID=319348 RepID=A0A9J6BSP0_POLVA|nr:hypothetical protein PVAND_002483 [Polypedilum vanderplanki]